MKSEDANVHIDGDGKAQLWLVPNASKAVVVVIYTSNNSDETTIVTIIHTNKHAYTKNANTDNHNEHNLVMKRS